MIEIPTDREISAAYDEELARKLLEIAGSDRVPLDKFSSMMFRWATDYAQLLRETLDFGSNPNVTDTRKELENIAANSERLFQSLMRLTNTSHKRLIMEMPTDPELSELSNTASAMTRLTNLGMELDELRRLASSAINNLDGTKFRDTSIIRANRLRRMAVG